MDIDGRINFSSIIKVNISSNSGFAVTITPNPVRDMLKITASGVTANETLQLEIVSANGMLIYRKSFRATGPATIKLMPRPGAPAGLYFYRITRKSNSQMVRGRVVFL